MTGAGAAAKPQFSPDLIRVLLTNAVLCLGAFQTNADAFILCGNVKISVFAIRYISQLHAVGRAEMGGARGELRCTKNAQVFAMLNIFCYM